MNRAGWAAVILAAGKGTRMKSDTPKVLHGLAGRPVIGHVLATVAVLGPARTVVVLAPGMDAVASMVAPVATVVQRRQLGTADAVKAARDALAGFVGDVLIMYADNPFISVETIEALRARRAAKDKPAVVVVGFRPADPLRYGRLELDRAGRLKAIVEYKDADARQRRIGFCNSGVMAIDGRHLFALIDRIGTDNAAGEFYLTDIVAEARRAKLGTAAIERPEEEFIGIDTRAQLALAERHVQQRLRAAAMEGGATLVDPDTVYLSMDTKIGRDVVIGPNVVCGPKVSIGDRAEILPFCHFEGAVIEDGARVGPFARLRPGARIGQNAHIGNFVEVKNATVEAGAKVNHLSYVGDARVGAKANVGAGTITCNYDGYFKDFTDIGAGAFIGSNTALVAPVKIGDGAIIGAGSVVTQDVPAEALRIERGQQTTVEGWATKFRTRRAREKAAKAAKPETPKVQAGKTPAKILAEG
ncbi:MAG: bifunctional UDP-N-acetylglucosamine diphosphorylase/glucosamine-1-phosphate N-acetyltransferase GlmU [Alphaproteobacteria bacterium]|nr:bifunctional UDP-N-acetylglucosamine diphosphorylase/glucosamine-1-phosphate N-acetyltransferase GlmU [Alphaproteobacteria bacterium]